MAIDDEELLAQLRSRPGHLEWRDRSPTMRDMFAAHALPAIATMMDIRRTADAAMLAYSLADAMMAERKKNAG